MAIIVRYEEPARPARFAYPSGNPNACDLETLDGRIAKAEYCRQSGLARAYGLVRVACRTWPGSRADRALWLNEAATWRAYAGVFTGELRRLRKEQVSAACMPTPGVRESVRAFQVAGNAERASLAPHHSLTNETTVAVATNTAAAVV